MDARWPNGPIGVLADDLTGAGDTALAFYQPGREVWIVPELSEARWPQATAIAVNTESRHLLPEQAAEAIDRAARALMSAGCTRFYKKVDSTLRGNLAAEIGRARQLLGCEIAVVAPAFPQAGRQTIGGNQLVEGLPVSVTSYGRDPLAPARESHLPTLLAQGGLEVAEIPLRTVLQGPEAIAGALAAAYAAERRVLVVDAARPADLSAIARAISMIPYRVLPVGSAGLAQALEPPMLAPPPAAELLLARRPPVLVVAGSLNPVSLAQVQAYAREARLVQADVQSLLLTESSGGDRLAAQILPSLLASQDVLVATALGEAQGREGRALGHDLAMGAVETGIQLANALGRVIARVVRDVELSGLVLTGGETALGVCRALGSPPLRVVGELLPAMPLCRVEFAGRSLRLVTKSGGFGAPDALTAMAQRLRRIEA
ncbi:MAG TPA: four-carbon acid sugar kinase family protein [Oscillatoriaceae cyanobacterium]